MKNVSSSFLCKIKLLDCENINNLLCVEFFCVLYQLSSVSEFCDLLTYDVLISDLIEIVIKSSERGFKYDQLLRSCVILCLKIKWVLPFMFALPHSWVIYGGSVTVESKAKFYDWFWFIGIFRKKWAPMSVAKVQANSTRGRNPRWPPLAWSRTR